MGEFGFGSRSFMVAERSTEIALSPGMFRDRGQRLPSYCRPKSPRPLVAGAVVPAAPLIPQPGGFAQPHPKSRYRVGSNGGYNEWWSCCTSISNKHNILAVCGDTKSAAIGGKIWLICNSNQFRNSNNYWQSGYTGKYTQTTRGGDQEGLRHHGGAKSCRTC